MLNTNGNVVLSFLVAIGLLVVSQAPFFLYYYFEEDLKKIWKKYV